MVIRNKTTNPSAQAVDAGTSSCDLVQSLMMPHAESMSADRRVIELYTDMSNGPVRFLNDRSRYSPSS